jgi:hypothetical protein
LREIFKALSIERAVGVVCFDRKAIRENDCMTLEFDIVIFQRSFFRLGSNYCRSVDKVLCLDERVLNIEHVQWRNGESAIRNALGNGVPLDHDRSGSCGPSLVNGPSDDLPWDPLDGLVS